MVVAFKKILFPTEFATSETPALTFAIQLAASQQGEVIVQHVVKDEIEREIHGEVVHDFSEIQKHMQVAAEGELEGLVSSFRGASPLRRVLSLGNPADEICASAEKENADLIVMGSSAGAITAKVIQSTTRPVLAFPAASPKGFAVKSILVATDFSKHSKELVRHALSLKNTFGASLHLLHVVETSSAIEFALAHGELSHAVAKVTEWAIHKLKELVPPESAGEAGITFLVERGHASRQIAAKAQEIGDCLTLIGTHRHGAAHTHLLGTTTNRLLLCTTQPVLTMKL